MNCNGDSHVFVYSGQPWEGMSCQCGVSKWGENYKWCHKFTPEGIIVMPHCKHNLSNNITTNGTIYNKEVGR